MKAFFMSAAPSTIPWDEWSSHYLDQTEPVKHGQFTEDKSFPAYWKGSVLTWTQLVPDDSLCVPPLNLTGNKLIVAQDDTGKDVIYSVGGLSQDSRTAGNSDSMADKYINLYKLTLDSGTYTWEKVVPITTGDQEDSETNEIPQGRYGHSCCYYKGKIYMYGGRTSVRYNVFGAQGTIQCYDIKERTWSELATLVTENTDYPQPRYGHACTIHGSIMYIQGGHVLYEPNRWGFTSELISFNIETNTWSMETPHYIKHPPPGQINAALSKPDNYLFLHRDFHVAFCYNGKIIIYGGRSPGFIITFDIYEFNLDTKRWKLIKPNGYLPRQRNHIAAEQIGCFMVCHGGEETHQWGESFCNDTFVIDMRTYHCTKLELYGSVCGRCNIASCVLSNGDMMLYGGESIATREEQGILHDRQHRLIYHNDVLILSLLPSLQLLCFDVIKSNGIDFSPLPPRLKQQITEYI